MIAIGPVQVLGASFFSTHHASAADALAGRERAYTPPPFALLAGRARRFTSLVTQLHVEVCGALHGPEAPTAVFATCHGEIQTAEALMADYRANAGVSSARFALSVHNTPSGLISVATANHAPSTTVTGESALAAGWLEAALTVLETGRLVLLSLADEPVPAMFGTPAQPVGVAAAFLLGPAGTGPSLELAFVPATEAPDPVQLLARAADAAMCARPALIALGSVQPGATLELHLREARP